MEENNKVFPKRYVITLKSFNNGYCKNPECNCSNDIAKLEGNEYIVKLGHSNYQQDIGMLHRFPYSQDSEVSSHGKSPKEYVINLDSIIGRGNFNSSINYNHDIRENKCRHETAYRKHPEGCHKETVKEYIINLGDSCLKDEAKVTNSYHNHSYRSHNLHHPTKYIINLDDTFCSGPFENKVRKDSHIKEQSPTEIRIVVK